MGQARRCTAITLTPPRTKLQTTFPSRIFKTPCLCSTLWRDKNFQGKLRHTSVMIRLRGSRSYFLLTDEMSRRWMSFVATGLPDIESKFKFEDVDALG